MRALSLVVAYAAGCADRCWIHRCPRRAVRVLRPTLFRVLILERGWENWSVFACHLEQAARDLAVKSDSPRLLGVSVARRTFDRWMIGESKGMPQADTRVALEYLLGFPCVALFGPPLDATSMARAEEDRGRVADAITISDRWLTSELFASAAGEVADSWQFRRPGG
ncbi:hypothetical protein [Streptomyces sp. NPDC055140]